MKRIMLIDASGLLFRAHFAMIKKPLRTKDGQPTSAVFGFFRMIFNLIKKYPSHYVAAAFDVPRSTLERTKSYNEYKATRKETPPELIEQIPLAKKCLELAGIPALTVDGHEADDVLATLSKKYDKDHEVFIFTGDKDLLQLVQNHTYVVIPDKNGIDGKCLDRDGVKEFKGVYPDEISDYLAIVGDTSDNVPGVKGIGEKGAIALIEEYHSLSNIYQNIDNIKSSLAKKLEDNRDNAFLSLELVTLQDNLPIDLPPVGDDLITLSSVATDAFVDRMRELELFSLLKEISADTPNKQIQTENTLFGVQNQKEVKPFELTTLDELSQSEFIGMQLLEDKIQFASAEHVYELSQEDILDYKGMIQRFFDGQSEDGKSFIVFDQKKLVHIFHKVGMVFPKVDDLKIMAYLIDPSRNKYSIEYLSLAYLGRNETMPSCFLELKNILLDELKKSELYSIYENMEMPLRSILAEIEEKGVKIDASMLQQLSHQIDQEMKIIESNIYHLAGKEFNVLSPKQLGQILFEEIGLQPVKKTKGKSYSTDEESLEILSFQHPLPKEILAYRSLSKIKSTYADSLVKAMDEHHRVHTTLCQTVAATGRLSSIEPNLQNIPIKTELGRKIREAFIPEPDHVLVSADYSQIELRLFALLSQDATMKKFFEEGGDVHKHTAAEMFKIPQDQVTAEQRRAAKTVNYGISYGMSAFRLSNELHISFNDAREFIDNYFETFPGVKKFMETTLAFAAEHGYVKTMFGRRRPTPELRSKKIDKVTNLSHPARFAINAVVQGTAADIIKFAMIEVDRLIKNEFSHQASLILQIHDELLFEVQEDIVDEFIEKIKHIMTNVITLDIPLEVEAGKGKNWNMAH